MDYRQSAGKIKSVAYLLGVYLGDGNIQKRVTKRYFRLNTIDKDFSETVSDRLKDISGYEAKIRKHSVAKSSNDNYALIHYECTDLCDYFEKETKAKEIIPEWVFDLSQENRKHFIAGLMDSEGYVSVDKRSKCNLEIGFKTASLWTYDFKKILESVGCIIKRVEICKPYKEHYKTCYRLRILPITFKQSGCYFNIKRKQERLEILRDYTPRSRKLQFLRDMI